MARMTHFAATMLLNAALIGCSAPRSSMPLAQPLVTIPHSSTLAIEWGGVPFQQHVQQVQLFDDEPPAFRIATLSRYSPIFTQERHLLLLPACIEEAVFYDQVEVTSRMMSASESWQHDEAATYWACDVDGNGKADLVILTWEWGENWDSTREVLEPNWDRPKSVRVVYRENSAPRYLGVQVDREEEVIWAQRADIGLTVQHLHAGLEKCDNPIWEDRIARVISNWDAAVN